MYKYVMSIYTRICKFQSLPNFNLLLARKKISIVTSCHLKSILWQARPNHQCQDTFLQSPMFNSGIYTSIKIALASTTTLFCMSFLPSDLTIDIEPFSAQEVTFYKWSEQTCSDLCANLVVLKYYPQQGSISLIPEGSQHAFSAKIEV